MKKLLIWLLCMLVVSGGFIPGRALAETEGLEVTARGAILVDAATGQVLYAYRETVQMPIASVTKVMTLLLIFEAIDAGKLSLEDEIMISAAADGMGGSQVYLAAGDMHKVDELLKSIIVASANDACVAMAEAVAGSESVFVARMNERAQEMGMINTNFVNCTGLPAAGAGSCALDVAVMCRELLTHEEYFNYSTIWMDTIYHSGGRITEISNTNRLLRTYDGVDGVKTGFTNEAMHCVASTAKRGDTRFISVILGGVSSAARFSEAAMLLDYGFANYETVNFCTEGEIMATDVPVEGSPVESVCVTAAQNGSVLVEKGATDDLLTEVEVPDTLQAPIEKNEAVGTLRVRKGEETILEVPLLAAEAAPQSTLSDWFQRLWRMWVPQECS